MLSRRYGVVALQETHGSPVEWQVLQHELRNSHSVFHSNFSNTHNKGGTAFIVQKSLTANAVSDPSFSEILEGRCVTLRIDY